MNLTGTLNNAGTTLVLSPAIGAWRLYGGTISGGTVTSTGGSELQLTGYSGMLAGGVTIAAGTTLDGTQNIGSAQEYAYVTGGLTLNGTLNLGSANGSVYGRLYFENGSQTLSGTSTVTFGSSINNSLQAYGPNVVATLTIGGRINIQGGSGTVNGYYTGDTIINDGTITVPSGQTITFGGANAVNAGLIGIAGGTLKLVGNNLTNAAGGLISGNGTFTKGSVTYVDDGVTDLNPPSILGVDLELYSVAITYDDAGGMNASTVTNAANYTLLGSGGDDIFGNGNDINQSGLISQITYNATTETATLELSGALPDDYYRVQLNGTAILDAAGTAVWNGTDQVNRLEDQTPAQVSVILDPASDHGTSNHDGLTNDTTPTFDVTVNQPGTISLDFEGNGTYVGTLYASAAGTYQLTAPTLTAGTYTAAATFDAVTGPVGQGYYTYTIDTTAPYVTAMTPTGTLNNGVSQVTVTFSKAMNPNTLTAAAFTLTGPNGAVPVNAPQLVSGNTYSISFADQIAQGTYTLVVAATVEDAAGNELDQDQDGTQGSADDSFSGTFTLALPDLAMTAPSPASSAVEGVSLPVSWQVTNISTANPTAVGWNDVVYLSTKATLDNTAIPLLTLPSPAPPLAPMRATRVIRPCPFRATSPPATTTCCSSPTPMTPRPRRTPATTPTILWPTRSRSWPRTWSLRASRGRHTPTPARRCC